MNAPAVSAENASGDSQLETRAIARLDRRITTVAWVVGVTGVVGFSMVDEHTTIGGGVAYAALAAMVTVVCCAILRQK